MGVKRLFRRGVALYPDRICVDDGTLKLEYREAGRLARRIAAALAAEGIAAGERCALLSPNTALAMVAILGVYEADAVFVPLSAASPADENARPCADCGVRVLFFDGSVAAAAEAIRAACPALALLVCLDGDAGGDVKGAIGLEAWLARHAAAEPPLRDDRKDDIVAIYPTGGSTGRPKRVLHTRLVWDTMAASFHSAVPPVAEPVFLAAAPITHGAGSIAMMLLAVGATIVLRRGFEAGAVLEAIESQRVTHTFLPPTAIYKLLEHPSLARRDVSSMKALMYGAAPMSIEKLKTCLQVFGPAMVQLWGQAEAPSFCTALDQADHLVIGGPHEGRLASCGRPTLLTEVEIMADDGRLLPAGEKGELVVRGSIVMAGYHENPAATAEVSAHGWHHSGDVGYKDADGYVYIVGRKKDMIISGGYNVYPSDVEQVLWAHPAVQECAVIGVPDETWGEAVHALIELKPGTGAEAEALIAWCKQRLGSVKSPKRIEFRTELPRNAVGKVDKVVLREPYWRGRSRQI